MKTKLLLKLFGLMLALFLSASVQAQSLTLNDLISLAKEEPENVSGILQNKGYSSESEKDRGGSVTQQTFKNNGYILIYDALNFGTSTTMLAWRFNDVEEYNDILNQLKSNGYKQTNLERRKGGKYVSQYFDRGEIRIIVTKDMAGEYDRNYSVSVMYMPIRKMIPVE